MTRQQRLRAVGLVLFMGVCFLIATYFFSLAGTRILPGGSHYTVQAVVPTTVALAPAADVREYGVNVGKVDKIAAAGPDGKYSLVDLELDSHAPVYQNAQVYIRAKSVADENYVEIDPGTPAAGAVPSGGVLAISHAQDATQVDQVFSILNQAKRTDVQRTLAGLATALSNGGQNLNNTLEALAALPIQGGSAAQVLASDQTQLGSLVNTFGEVASALGQRASAIQLFTKRVKTTAVAVAARDQRLEATLAALPPFLAQATTTANRLDSFSRNATPVVSNLRIAANDLVPTVSELLPAAREGRLVVGALNRFATAATPAVRQLKPFSATAISFVPRLEPFLRQIKPMVSYLEPYRNEVSSFFADDAASFQQTDRLGHVARIVLPVSQSDIAGVLTPQEEALLKKLEGSLDTRGDNAYPAPGHADSGAPFTGSFPRIQPDPPYSNQNR